ncbi:hypothetical protein, partial [Phytoactinopolyspora mesophila]|uniref:hypothetical protein n=1 Tax=Phytoactinopolyspora mesophila TaxID=2650750 RepID=UPI001C9E6DBF
PARALAMGRTMAHPLQRGFRHRATSSGLNPTTAREGTTGDPENGKAGRTSSILLPFTTPAPINQDHDQEVPGSTDPG